MLVDLARPQYNAWEVWCVDRIRPCLSLQAKPSILRVVNPALARASLTSFVTSKEVPSVQVDTRSISENFEGEATTRLTHLSCSLHPASKQPKHRHVYNMQVALQSMDLVPKSHILGNELSSYVRRKRIIKREPRQGSCSVQ
jgi:hypothetical protein